MMDPFALGSRRLVAVVIAATAAAAISLGLASTVWSGTSPTVQFGTIPPAALPADGINLTPPQSSPPTAASAVAATESEAATLATQAGHRPILEAEYAHCSLPNQASPVDEDCWAFSLDPSGLTSTTGIPATYFIILIDPNTGNVLLSGWGWYS